ncbi:NAD synthetase [Burkholderia pseudomallei]|nr:NAD synthetase [Burkholderia pseudomallei]
MSRPDQAARRRAIAAELHVSPTFDARDEAERRIGFVADYLRTAGLRACVLGISGGIDSSTAGRLAQLAVERLRASGYDARFVAMRLPYGAQHDEADARRALAFVRADETLTVDVKPAADAMLAALAAGGLAYLDHAQQDFVLGNIKARERMIAQYAVAGARNGVVIGTDHAAESVMGFFTKFGDGGADVLPLAGLTKRRVRERRPHERRAHPLDDVHELPEVEPPDILQHDHRLGAVEQRQCLREPLGHRRIDARPHHRLDGEREQPPAVAAPVLRLVLRAPRTLVRPLMQRHLQRGAQRALVLLHARIREVEQLVHARLDRRRRRLPLQHRPEALVDDGAHERRLRREVAVSGGARHAGCVRELGDRWKPALFEHRQRSLQQQLAGLRARFGQRFRCGYGSRHVSCEDDR